MSRELSADLHRVFEARQQDDYQKLEPVGLDEATGAIAPAERFLEAVREYLTQAGYLLHEWPHGQDRRRGQHVDS